MASAERKQLDQAPACVELYQDVVKLRALVHELDLDLETIEAHAEAVMLPSRSGIRLMAVAVSGQALQQKIIGAAVKWLAKEG